jgi:hypothetical protein
MKNLNRLFNFGYKFDDGSGLQFYLFNGVCPQKRSALAKREIRYLDYLFRNRVPEHPEKKIFLSRKKFMLPPLPHSIT